MVCEFGKINLNTVRMEESSDYFLRNKNLYNISLAPILRGIVISFAMSSHY